MTLFVGQWLNAQEQGKILPEVWQQESVFGNDGDTLEHCFLCGYEVLVNGIQSIGDIEKLANSEQSAG